MKNGNPSRGNKLTVEEMKVAMEAVLNLRKACQWNDYTGLIPNREEKI